MSDGAKSYELALAVLREASVREGFYKPVNDRERRWAKEGLRHILEFDTLRDDTIDYDRG